ncbi:osmoprotectant transport system permease protein [Friedmanniella endophytica]|uniref:Osmoprotectant transport system permease protein n=1 Tax=Microlunatus kandeliicorticis TaxID=1759536 RepID=A0A7W3P4Z1_9ACTN|nr:ABC transporter permease subunit [Microlunatus kandeliicorticis]MBA8793411.1 osmoprotectant transport system permease protein [Microlunatus kandeliicorticis]
MSPDWDWLARNTGMILRLLGLHVVLSVLPVLIGLVLAIPIGYLVSRCGPLANAILAVWGIIYAIPSLALFVAMPSILGTKILDPVNVVAALAVYALALLVRSVVDGLRSVPAEVKQSATALGYGSTRRLLRVELPLAMPVIFAGLRVVTVSTISLVTVGALIGLGALGDLLTYGFNSAFYTPVLTGIVLVVVLALVADAVILLLQRGLLPWSKGVRTA